MLLGGKSFGIAPLTPCAHITPFSHLADMGLAQDWGWGEKGILASVLRLGLTRGLDFEVGEARG